MWRLVFTSRQFSTYLVCFVYSLIKILCKLDSLLLLSSLLEILNLKLFCKSLNIIYYFCKILSCWYFLRSPSCDTSGVFRSACGLEIPVKLHLIKHFNSTGLSHSAQTQSTWAVREWEWALAPCHMGTTANDSPLKDHANCGKFVDLMMATGRNQSQRWALRISFVFPMAGPAATDH